MLVAIADTHAALWYLVKDARLSAKAASILETAANNSDTIGIASITFVEMVYLSERNRISSTALTRIYAALDEPQPLFVEIPLDRAIARSLATVDRQAIPDMPDRIIAATAVHNGVPLISRDGKIQLSTVPTIW
jgi:PIN domain nuclease of toxin-antitoxin system